MGHDPRVESIFAAALEKPADERSAFLEASCAGDADLRTRVEALLRAHAQAGSFLQPPSSEDAPTLGAAQAPPPGTRIRYVGDYELLEEIARGGMGVVFKARQVSLNRIVAVKMILAGQLASEADVQRFKSEAEAAANLDHPNIVPIYEVGEHEGQHYFSMKLIEGGSLAAWNADCGLRIVDWKTAGQRSVGQLVATIARAVHHAHQRGLLHRDLKPANILLQTDQSAIRNPKSAIPMITDFGLAKKVAGASQTQSGAIVGTPSYMSPEQAAGTKVLTTAIDVYALGAILYYLLTGQPPFQAESPLDTLLQVLDREPQRPRSLNPAIDIELEIICLKCLRKEPAERYGSAEALAEDLDRWLAGEPIQARSISTMKRAVKWARRKPAIAALGAAVLLSVIFGVAGIAWQWLRAERHLKAAVSERNQAEAARAQTELAREETQGMLAGSLFEQAHAVLNGREPGRRWHALELLQKAEQLRGRQRDRSASAPSDQESSALLTRLPDCAELRSTAVSALLLADAHVAWESQAHVEVDPRVGLPAISADGRRLSTLLSLSFHDGTTECLFDADHGRKLGEWTSREPLVLVRTLNSDGSLCAWYGKEQLQAKPRSLITISKSESGQMERRLQWPDPDLQREWTVYCLAFSPDDRFLFAMGELQRSTDAPSSRLIACWDLKSNAEPKTLSGEFQRWVTVRSDSKMFAVGQKQKVVVYLTETMETAVEIKLDKARAVGRAAFDPKDHILAIPCRSSDDEDPDKSFVLLADLYNNGKTRRLDVDEFIGGAVAKNGGGFLPLVDFSPDGTHLAVATCSSANDIRVLAPGSIRILDALQGKEICRLDGAHKHEIGLVHWIDGGRHLLSWSIDRLVKCWEFQDDQPVSLLQMAQDPDTALAGDFTIGARPTKFLQSPDGKWLAVRDGIVGATVVLERNTALPTTSSSHRLDIDLLMFKADGRQIVTFDWSKAAAISIDVASGKDVARVDLSGQFPARNPLREDLTFATNADGKELVAGRDLAGRVCVWKLASGDKLWEMPERDGGVAFDDVRISRDGQLLAAIPESPAIWGGSDFGVWEIPAGKKLARFQSRGELRPTRLLSFSADNHWLATVDMNPDDGGVEQQISVWDLRSTKQALRITGPSMYIAADFSPDSRLLVLGFADGTAQLWDVQKKEMLFQWKAHPQALSHIAFTPDGESIASCDGLSPAIQFLHLPTLRRQLAEVGLDW